jgi:hypothetical protein
VNARPLPQHEEADYSPARSAIRPPGTNAKRFALTSVGSTHKSPANWHVLGLAVATGSRPRSSKDQASSSGASRRLRPEGLEIACWFCADRARSQETEWPDERANARPSPERSTPTQPGSSGDNRRPTAAAADNGPYVAAHDQLVCVAGLASMDRKRPKTHSSPRPRHSMTRRRS